MTRGHRSRVHVPRDARHEALQVWQVVGRKRPVVAEHLERDLGDHRVVGIDKKRFDEVPVLPRPSYPEVVYQT